MGQRTLGVIGTMVWDRILDRDGREEPVEEWGGIGYGLAALQASLEPGWTILPIVKVGRDLAEEAYRFLREMPGVDPSAIAIVPEPNNRVELRYETTSRRAERMSGGVPPWTWPELAPLVDLCDALYVNFISGFEMGLDTARSVRTGYPGPIYTDLHSLFLGLGQRGLRVPQGLTDWAQWLRCSHAVQMNEEEFDLLGRAWGDPWHLAADTVGPDLKLITVTLGPRGAAYVVGADFDPDPFRWERARSLAEVTPARSGRVPVEGGERTGDPTGCGDVWGATFFARILGGDGLDGAMREANRLAARNVEHRGARGLFRHLAGRLSHTEERR